MFKPVELFEEEPELIVEQNYLFPNYNISIWTLEGQKSSFCQTKYIT